MTTLTNSTTVNKRGRKSSSDSFRTISVCLTQAQWNFISLWLPTGNPSAALRALLDRAMIFWPLGPFVFGHASKSRRLS